MKKTLFRITFFLVTAFASCAWSHSMWVNLNESFTHHPGHAIASLGWGHTVPMDDLLSSESGSVNIEKYQLIDPDSQRADLGLPVIKKGKETKTSSGMILESGDLGIRRIGLTDKSKKGTYQVIAESKATYFTGYVDKNGKMQMTTKPMDKIKGAKKFNFSTRYKAVAKSYMTIGDWTKPKASGFDLEITPLSDLSSIKKDDLAKFEVTLNGKKLTCDMKGMNYLFATSNTYGGPDKFNLCSHIIDGKAQVRMPSAGQWVFSVIIKKEVKKDNELKDLYGKCNSIFYGSTISVNVAP